MKLISKNKRNRWIMGSILLLVIIFTAGCVIYINDYYHADVNAMETMASEREIEGITLEDGKIIWEPQGAEKGLIFYPGGKVEYTAYVPLMQACAEQNILCVLVEMPFHLAVLDKNAADGIQENYPEIQEWYIGGHSLGGAMAASYLADHADQYAGLLLLGAYATEDLSRTNLKTLSVFGSEDHVMNREKYDNNRENLPENFTEKIIEGGCHAYFGVYGSQEGDGIPTISNEQQIRDTAAAISEWMNP